jgi:hypothetical protein
MTRCARFALLVVGAIAAISGCGGDDPAEPPRSPLQQCEDFLDAWCNQNAECELPSERARVREDCHFVVELEINCRAVRAISATYSDCIDAIAASTCNASGAVELPMSCRGVLVR